MMKNEVKTETEITEKIKASTAAAKKELVIRNGGLCNSRQTRSTLQKTTRTMLKSTLKQEIVAVFILLLQFYDFLAI